MVQIVGSDLSRVGGYYNAIQEAKRIGGNCLQLYTSAPQRLTFALDNLTQDNYDDLAKAKDFLKKSKTSSVPMHLFIHSPYTINLCDVKKMTLNATVLRQQLEICELAGGVGVVVHTGSQGKEQKLHHAYETYVRTIRQALHGFTGKSRVLMETCAGQGRSIGVKIEAFSRLYHGFTKEERSKHMGIVIDTCHIFAAGYDISTISGVNDFYHRFHQHILMSDVMLIHLNDSKKKCGTCVDRHAHLGEGFVFKTSTDALAQLFCLYPNVPFLLETHDKTPYLVYEKEIAMCKDIYQKAVCRSAKKKTIKKSRQNSVLSSSKSFVVSSFQELAEVYYSQQDNFRGDIYLEAAYFLDTLDTIPSTRKELKAFRGIGDSIADKTIEMLYTGKMSYLDTLKNDRTIQDKIDILRVSGIGLKTFEQLQKKGICTLQQLRDAHSNQTLPLTHAQLLGLCHYDDLLQRIPRRDIRAFDTYMQEYTQQNGKQNTLIQFVGSYRREKSTSGDIDILLKNVTIDECVDHIQKKYSIVGFITHGKEKSSFLIALKNTIRRVDMLVTNAHNYVAALVYFTGSKFFNIRMRLVAKDQGYILNEHGLTHVKTKKTISLQKEKDLFDVLGMDYIVPKLR